MNKTKLAWLLVILLAVLNITTIFTIVHRNNLKQKKAESIIMEPGKKPLSSSHVKDALGFNDKQMEVFRQNKRLFRQEASRIINKMNFQKELMFNEMQFDEPDTIKLDSISAEIGVLHKELKMLTVKFYISIKNECNVEQKEKLKTFFTPLFKGMPCGKPDNNDRKNRSN